jgi:hypothetical protein
MAIMAKSSVVATGRVGAAAMAVSIGTGTASVDYRRIAGVRGVGQDVSA